MPVPTPTPADLPPVLALLAETPTRLAAWAAPFLPEQLAQPPGPKGWSAVEHLAHLRGCDAVWTETIYAMLVEAEPDLPLLHPRTWAHKLQYHRRPWAEQLAALTARRAELLTLLTPLPLEGWLRGANIGGRRHTVYSQARRLAWHEREHWPQIEALLAAPRPRRAPAQG